ncbi:MAG: hypothetical protein CFE26_21790 [Verrucomicrobiales bacterium VVV1]|nr:MAG: hypothetical protein CFE26_21790 [Verrucomicrobiales bacterium VVV1]
MKKIILTLASAAVLAATVHAISPNSATPATGSGMFRGHAREVVMGIIGELKDLRAKVALTEDQRSQIQGIVKSHKPEIGSQLEKGRDARRAMQAAVEAHGADSAEASKAADAVADAARSRALLTAKIRSEVAPVLTQEQREEMKATRGRIEDSVDELLGKFGE